VVDLWHLRYCRIYKNKFRDIQTLTKGVDSCNEKDNVILGTPCIKRKQHRIKFLKKGSTKSKQILGLG
jgi:hypothetical protein